MLKSTAFIRRQNIFIVLLFSSSSFPISVCSHVDQRPQQLQQWHNRARSAPAGTKPRMPLLSSPPVHDSFRRPHLSLGEACFLHKMKKEQTEMRKSRNTEQRKSQQSTNSFSHYCGTLKFNHFPFFSVCRPCCLLFKPLGSLATKRPHIQ